MNTNVSGADASSSGARARQAPSYPELLLEHRARLLHYVRGRVPNDPASAEDIIQVASVKGISAFDGFRGDSSFWWWMRRIVDRCIADYYRQQQSRPVAVGMDDAEAYLETPDTTDVAAVVVEDQHPIDDVLVAIGLGDFVRALPPRQAFAFRVRCAYEMRGMPEKTVPEVARALGISLRAAEHLDYRSRKLLRDLRGWRDEKTS